MAGRPSAAASGGFEGKELIGRNTADQAEHGLLLAEGVHGDFLLRVRYRSVVGNSGLYFRSERVDGAVGVHGFQAEIDPLENQGGLYETGGRAWVVPTDGEAYKPDRWNDMIVICVGRDVRVVLNGVLTARLDDDDGRTEGRVGLQLHGGQDMEVRFQRVELLPLTDEIIYDSREIRGSDFVFANVFGDGMVLQREEPVRLWGFGAPGSHGQRRNRRGDGHDGGRSRRPLGGRAWALLPPARRRSPSLLNVATSVTSWPMC